MSKRRHADRHVTISVVGNRKRRLRAGLIGDDVLAGGVGGWEETERNVKKRKKQVMSHRDTPAFTLQLPLLISGIDPRRGHADHSVERECRTLIDLGRPHRRKGNPEKLHLEGPLRAPGGIEWVIDDIEWGAQIRHDHGFRIQQEVLVSLSQWRKPLDLGPADKARGKGGKGK